MKAKIMTALFFIPSYAWNMVLFCAAACGAPNGRASGGWHHIVIIIERLFANIDNDKCEHRVEKR